MTNLSDLKEVFRLQARNCAALGSPFMDKLMQLMADRLAPGDAVSDALFNWPGDRSASGASVPLLLVGGLHMLVLCNKDPVQIKGKQRSDHAANLAKRRKI